MGGDDKLDYPLAFGAELLISGIWLPLLLLNRFSTRNLEDFLWEAKKAKKQKEEPKKQHELKFTLLSLANLKKSKAPASQVIHQESEQSPAPDSSTERHDEVKQETREDDVFNIEDATSAFVPLRSGMLLSDTIHINPDAMSVQVIGLGRKNKNQEFFNVIALVYAIVREFLNAIVRVYAIVQKFLIFDILVYAIIQEFLNVIALVYATVHEFLIVIHLVHAIVHCVYAQTKPLCSCLCYST
ncbi:uncharacterized protein CEXT_343241 [Caerostris extrusa]|uniref:Uncharacterized protein n=1 Tax=Caerostris extrusa TaxID=172846 RepID=A0AAV4RD36_CAEEX|nr:uncharacterized protein CEXT_343241 [Caerostris extrusa]